MNDVNEALCERIFKISYADTSKFEQGLDENPMERSASMRQLIAPRHPDSKVSLDPRCFAIFNAFGFSEGRAAVPRGHPRPVNALIVVRCGDVLVYYRASMHGIL